MTLRAMSSAALFAVAALFLSSTAQGQPLPPPPQREVKLPALFKAKPLAVSPKDSELQKLLKARYNVAVKETRALYAGFAQGRGGMEAVSQAAIRIYQAGMEAPISPQRKAALLDDYVELMARMEDITQARFEAGRVGIAELQRAKYEHLHAKILRLRAKQKGDRSKGIR